MITQKHCRSPSAHIMLIKPLNPAPTISHPNSSFTLKIKPRNK
nr:MAG TPA: hypothetical protein [Caudoviricetes sp.]